MTVKNNFLLENVKERYHILFMSLGIYQKNFDSYHSKEKILFKTSCVVVDLIKGLGVQTSKNAFVGVKMKTNKRERENCTSLVKLYHLFLSLSLISK